VHDTRKNRGNSKKSIKIKTIYEKKQGFCNNKSGLKNGVLFKKMAKRAKNWKKERFKIEEMDDSNA